MSHANIESEDGVEAARRLVTFATVPRMLAYLSRLDITDRITFTERAVVGAGAFGDISIGKCNVNRRRKVDVAVKRLRLHLKHDIKLLLEKEVYVWSKLNHKNVLPLIGYAFDKDTGYPMLISEWMVNGSAWTYVTNNPRCDLLRLIIGIARGLAYLHANDVVHSDIKSDNVLVSSIGDALICDFGFARTLNGSRSLGNLSIGGEGTPQYMAYELLAHSETYTNATKETDVWAFGVTVYELYTRQRPYGELGPLQVPLRIIQRNLLEFPDSPIDPHTIELTNLLRRVCGRCWVLDPNERATATELLNILQLEQESYSDAEALEAASRSEPPTNSKCCSASASSELVRSSAAAAYSGDHRDKHFKATHSDGESLASRSPLTSGLLSTSRPSSFASTQDANAKREPLQTLSFDASGSGMMVYPPVPPPVDTRVQNLKDTTNELRFDEGLYSAGTQGLIRDGSIPKPLSVTNNSGGPSRRKRKTQNLNKQGRKRRIIVLDENEPRLCDYCQNCGHSRCPSDATKTPNVTDADYMNVPSRALLGDRANYGLQTASSSRQAANVPANGSFDVKMNRNQFFRTI